MKRLVSGLPARALFGAMIGSIICLSASLLSATVQQEVAPPSPPTVEVLPAELPTAQATAVFAIEGAHATVAQPAEVIASEEVTFLPSATFLHLLPDLVMKKSVKTVISGENGPQQVMAIKLSFAGDESDEADCDDGPTVQAAPSSIYTLRDWPNHFVPSELNSASQTDQEHMLAVEPMQCNEGTQVPLYQCVGSPSPSVSAPPHQATSAIPLIVDHFQAREAVVTTSPFSPLGGLSHNGSSTCLQPSDENCPACQAWQVTCTPSYPPVVQGGILTTPNFSSPWSPPQLEVGIPLSPACDVYEACPCNSSECETVTVTTICDSPSPANLHDLFAEAMIENARQEITIQCYEELLAFKSLHTEQLAEAMIEKARQDVTIAYLEELVELKTNHVEEVAQAATEIARMESAIEFYREKEQMYGEFAQLMAQNAQLVAKLETQGDYVIDEQPVECSETTRQIEELTAALIRSRRENTELRVKLEQMEAKMVEIARKLESRPEGEVSR